MAVPALRIPVSGDIADFKRKMSETSSLVSATAKAAVKEFAGMNGSIAGQLATTALGFTRQGIAIKLGYAGIATAVVATFAAMNAIIDLGREKIKEFTDLADNASRLNVSTDFLQRMTEGVKDLKLEADLAKDALETMKKAAEGRLGGSAIQRRIGELSDAGNFAGNSGVGALSQANTGEEKYQAIVKLVTEALEKGERLAALDIAEKAFGGKMADALRLNSNLFTDMEESAKRVAAEQLITPEEIARAFELKTRLEEANRVIDKSFKPVMKDLAGLGMQYEQSWVEIIETLAQGAKLAASLHDSIKQIPDAFAAAGNSPFWQKLNTWLRAKGLADESGLTTIAPSATGAANGTQMAAGYARLAADLSDPGKIRAAMGTTIAIQNSVLGDRSRDPNANKKTATETAQQRLDQVQRYINALQKAEEVSQAELNTIGLSNVERAKAVALAEAQAAARARGKPLDDAEVQSIERYAVAVANLKEKLETSRPLERFANDAANLNKQLVDVSIGGLRSLEDSILGVVDGTKSVKEAFSDMARSILSDLARIAIRQAIVAPLARGLLGAFTGGIGGGGGGGTGFSLSGTGGLYAGGGYTGSGGKHEPAGIVHRGEYVFSKDVVDKIGVRNLERLHQGYSAGGLVMPGGEHGKEICL